mmetsp:Transcript_24830/g.78756  ORF Transcript_24830/g.78756 Transcript_24830/m.78756 type:complete len:119 (+) Transcript_24830:766-1122(+)
MVLGPPLSSVLPAAEPCYALLRHSSEGAPLLFLYSCPDGAAVRAKMLHASCKGAVLASLSGRGLEVSKSLEGEPSDLTHERLSSELSAPVSGAAGGAEAPAVRKAAPRGGRKLTSRRG